MYVLRILTFFFQDALEPDTLSWLEDNVHSDCRNREDAEAMLKEVHNTILPAPIGFVVHSSYHHHTTVTPDACVFMPPSSRS